MRYSLAALALAGLSYAAPQQAKAPTTQPASSCQKTVPGSFQIQVVNVTRKRDVLEERQAGQLMITLNNGVLKDSQGRTGEIVANRQFQFDDIIQPDAVYTSGFAVCSNGTLVLGNQAVFYQCLSGNFYNLYDRSQGGQCGPIYIQTIGTQGSSGAVQTGSASQAPDGQVTAVPGASSRPVSQIADGQLQATTSAPPRPITQIADGQVQGPRVTQIADGQIQNPTGKPASQIPDGQIQAPTSAGRPVSQISDGQVQARPSATGRPVSAIGDGQLQAPPTGRPVSAIGDGQLQASTGRGNMTTPRPTVAAYTGAAALPTLGSGLLGVAGVIAVAML